MGTNTSLTGLVLLSTIGTTSIALDYQNLDSIAPQEKVQYKFDDTKTWHYNQISNPFEFNIQNTEEAEKLQVVVDFASEMISNSEDLDSEFSRIVTENFMDLL